MPANEYLTAVHRLGMNAEQSGWFFGFSGRSGQRYASGEAAVPQSVAMLLRLMLRLQLSPEKVQKSVVEARWPK